MFCEVVWPFPPSLLKLPSISRYCNNVVITPRRSEWKVCINIAEIKLA